MGSSTVEHFPEFNHPVPAKQKRKRKKTLKKKRG
jgi:hypothetical protein